LRDCPKKIILPDSGGLQPPPQPPAHTPMRTTHASDAPDTAQFMEIPRYYIVSS